MSTTPPFDPLTPSAQEITTVSPTPTLTIADQWYDQDYTQCVKSNLQTRLLTQPVFIFIFILFRDIISIEEIQI